jgi:hypothetical protein
MITQYVYNIEEHQEAIKNKYLADIIKSEIEKGSFGYFGKNITSIDDFIITYNMSKYTKQ